MSDVLLRFDPGTRIWKIRLANADSWENLDVEDWVTIEWDGGQIMDGRVIAVPPSGYDICFPDTTFCGSVAIHGKGDTGIDLQSMVKHLIDMAAYLKRKPHSG
jgi:hypothetical protein